MILFDLSMGTHMQILRERYFVIHTENRPGELLRLSAVLMYEGVDCSGIWGSTPTRSEGLITLIPRNAAHFKEVAKAEGWRTSEGMCFVLEGRDKTGALVEILSRLAEDGINLTMLDAVAVEGKFGCHLWVDDSEIEHVAQALGLSVPKP
jgi:hypothetical protein